MAIVRDRFGVRDTSDKSNYPDPQDVLRQIQKYQRRSSMERVRAKFSVSNILKDQYGTVVVKLYAVYKGDESSPENESFSNSTPSGSVELSITNPSASEFFEQLSGKYVYLDFTAAE
jgi:hypothetical protein